MKCSILATFQLCTEVWFHDKPSKKHIGSSPEADSPRSNDRHFEGNDLCQDRVSKLLGSDYISERQPRNQDEILLVPPGSNGT